MPLDKILLGKKLYELIFIEKFNELYLTYRIK